MEITWSKFSSNKPFSSDNFYILKYIFVADRIHELIPLKVF